MKIELKGFKLIEIAGLWLIEYSQKKMMDNLKHKSSVRY